MFRRLLVSLICCLAGCAMFFCNWFVWLTGCGLVVWLIWSHVTFQFSFQSIITTYHFNWHISAFKPRFHTTTLVDRLHANIMALVRQDLQIKVTDAFVHLNTRAPTARKKRLVKIHLTFGEILLSKTLPNTLSYLSMNPTVSLIQPNSILLFKIKSSYICWFFSQQ